MQKVKSWKYLDTLNFHILVFSMHNLTFVDYGDPLCPSVIMFYDASLISLTPSQPTPCETTIN